MKKGCQERRDERGEGRNAQRKLARDDRGDRKKGRDKKEDRRWKRKEKLFYIVEKDSRKRGDTQEREKGN